MPPSYIHTTYASLSFEKTLAGSILDFTRVCVCLEKPQSRCVLRASRAKMNDFPVARKNHCPTTDVDLQLSPHSNTCQMCNLSFPVHNSQFFNVIVYSPLAVLFSVMQEKKSGDSAAVGDPTPSPKPRSQLDDPVNQTGGGSSAADCKAGDAVAGNSVGAGHSSGSFAALASTRLDEEQEEAGAHPPSRYEGDSSRILGAGSINSAAGQPQLYPQQSPVFGASVATPSTIVLRLQRIIVDVRLESEGIHVSELTMQLINRLTQQQQLHSVSASIPRSQIQVERHVSRGHGIKSGDFNNDVNYASLASDKEQVTEILDQFQQTVTMLKIRGILGDGLHSQYCMSFVTCILQDDARGFHAADFR